MTFRCDNCKKTTQPGEKMTRRVVETRSVTYPPRSKANRNYDDDAGGHGTETVREEILCESCA